jgi:hypothetical protein
MAGLRDYLQRGLRRDVRAVLIGVCCTAGGLAGLWQGMLAVPTGAPSADAWIALADVMRPVMIGVGTGVILGGLCATALCICVPWLRPSRDRT